MIFVLFLDSSLTTVVFLFLVDLDFIDNLALWITKYLQSSDVGQSVKLGMVNKHLFFCSYSSTTEKSKCQGISLSL